MSERHLHVVSADEAQLLTMRAAALARFKARYRHEPESERTMAGALRRLARTSSSGLHDETTFPWEVLVDEDLALHVWRSVADRYAQHTVTKDASALRVMLDCCRKVGLLTYEQYRHATSFEAKGGQARLQPGHYLTETDVAAMASCAAAGPRNPNTRIRDVALLLSLASTGARGDEVAHINLKELDLPNLRIGLTHTKSGEPRDAWLHPNAANAIERWVRVRGSQPGPLFVPLSRVGRPLLDHGALSTHQVWKIVRRLAAEASLEAITPHDLRRFVISTLLDRGIDLARVAKIVGHKNPATTAGYDRRPGRMMRAAVAQLDLPSTLIAV